MFRRNILLAFSFLLIFYSFASAQNDQSYNRKLQQYLNQYQDPAARELMIHKMINSYKKLNIKLSNSHWEKLELKMKTTFHEKYMEKVLPIYKRYLDESDLDAILAFNNTPSGRKIKFMQPILVQNLNEFMLDYGKQIAKEIINSN